MTMPKYLVITKSMERGGEEQVLIVVAPNCDDPLPSELPQGIPIRCDHQDLVNVYRFVKADVCYLCSHMPA